MDRTLTAAGWAAATATSASLRGAVMSEFFEFEYLDLPHQNHEKAEYDAAVAALRAKLLTLSAGGMSKQVSRDRPPPPCDMDDGDLRFDGRLGDGRLGMAWVGRGRNQ